jgi:hypothetical protein
MYNIWIYYNIYNYIYIAYIYKYYHLWIAVVLKPLRHPSSLHLTPQISSSSDLRRTSSRCCCAWENPKKSPSHNTKSWCEFRNIFGGFLKWRYSQIIHFNRIFHYKPSFLGVDKTTKIRKPNHLWIINTIYSQPSKSGLPPSGNHNYMMLFSFGGFIQLNTTKTPKTGYPAIFLP